MEQLWSLLILLCIMIDSYLHFLADEVGNDAPVFFLTVAHQTQCAIVYFDDGFAPLSPDDHFQRAHVQAAEEFRNSIDPT